MLLDSVHEAIVEAFKVPDDNCLQRLYELEPLCFKADKGKSADFKLMELTILNGRSIDAKRNLYKTIVKKLYDSLCIDSSDIFILINEQPLENWGIGGKAACDLSFGIKDDA